MVAPELPGQPGQPADGPAVRGRGVPVPAVPYLRRQGERRPRGGPAVAHRWQAHHQVGRRRLLPEDEPHRLLASNETTGLVVSIIARGPPFFRVIRRAPAERGQRPAGPDVTDPTDRPRGPRHRPPRQEARGTRTGLSKRRRRPRSPGAAASHEPGRVVPLSPQIAGCRSPHPTPLVRLRDTRSCGSAGHLPTTPPPP